jgi:TolB protein
MFIKSVKILFAALVTIYSLNARAFEGIYISKGSNQMMPIAINNFVSESFYDKSVLENVLSVMENDLRHCGFFKLIPTGAFIETTTGVSHKPHFASWRQINANLLLNGHIVRNGSGSFVLKIILWDTVSEKSILAQSFNAPVKMWRKLAHQVADKIYESVTGDKGYFDTKIYYVSDIIKGTRVSKKLAMMDYDGFGNKFLSDGRFLVLTPRISPNAKHLLYVSYEKRAPKIFIRDLSTGKSRLLGTNCGASTRR